MNRFTNKILMLSAILAAFAIVPVVSYGQSATSKTENVNVVNVPQVKIGNTPKVLNANDLNIFQGRVDKDTSNNVDLVLFTVPTGKRLVIEFASLRVNADEGEQISAFIRAGDNFTDAIHPIVMTFQQSSSGKDLVVGGQQLRMYAEPNTAVELLVSRTKNGVGASSTAHISGSISGYLVDVP